MLRSWEKHSQRVGMVAGFVVLPLLWWLQDALLFSVFGIGSRSESELFLYFLGGAIPGVILGAGISKAVLASRQNEWGDAKWHLISHAAAVLFLFFWFATAPGIWSEMQRPSGGTFLLGIYLPRWLAIFISKENLTFLPLQLAILMLFIGFAMRSKR